MVTFFDQLVWASAQRVPDKPALIHRDATLDYRELDAAINSTANKLVALGIEPHDRVAVFLPKIPENIIGMFAANRANAVFVPINAVLKAAQVHHILQDCKAKALITSSARISALKPVLEDLPSLQHIILIDKQTDVENLVPGVSLMSAIQEAPKCSYQRIDSDLAAILYTSGSTGKAKGVMLSHRNLTCGAHSVASYLGNTEDDTILALLPLSFDYGLSQASTAFLVGASCVLMDYYLPQDVVKTIAEYSVTGLAAVPPLWQQLLKTQWSDKARHSIRYFTNSGGAMPPGTLEQLRGIFPTAKPFLMYGLTEAFRSTFLEPAQIDLRPGSIGKAIPNAGILVVREDGSECDAGEPGELIHRGPLVSLGYWNDPVKTAKRFKPLPIDRDGLVLPELAVWSGDTVVRDQDGFLYFIGRKDEMIKTSGYRVSPVEIEDACYLSLNDIAEVVATGVPDPELGQAIAVLLVLKNNATISEKDVLAHIKRNLPNFMHPKYLEIRGSLPRNPNGKIDRRCLVQAMRDKYANA